MINSQIYVFRHDAKPTVTLKNFVQSLRFSVYLQVKTSFGAGVQAAHRHRTRSNPGASQKPERNHPGATHD